MKRLACLLGGAVLLAGALPHALEAQPRRGGPGAANPSALVAVEMAFARMAREKGQWKAFREYADDNGVMFVPEPVLAREWLRGRDEPESPVQWSAHEVWMSCDGSLGVTKGGWTSGEGKAGYFTTIWRRQKKGDYAWVLDQGDSLAEPLEKPFMLSATVADCPATRQRPSKDEDKPEKLEQAPMRGGGKSRDGTLVWSYSVDEDMGRRLAVLIRQDGEMIPVVSSRVAGQGEP